MEAESHFSHILDDKNALEKLVRLYETHEGFASVVYSFFQSRNKGQELLLWAITQEVERTSTLSLSPFTLPFFWCVLGTQRVRD
jgi:hypothetical protein